MKSILFFLSLICIIQARAQDPVYVQMKSNYQYKGIKMDSLFVLPNLDTANARKVTGAVVRMGSAYYWYNSTAWVALSAGGGGSTDTTSLSNRINDKIDSLRRLGIQVSFKKNGTWYNAYTDSLGGQNGTFGNDTALIILAKVRNATATTMARGTVVVLNGAIGDVASVIRANNKYDSTSATTIGLVKDPIAAGDTGYVVTQGQAIKLNLGSFTAGDALYLDSLDGELTKNKPIAPYHQVFVCIVARANAGNGLAYVKPQNGQELGELHDVWITNPINNQVLVYSDTQNIWKNRNVYSVVDTTSLSNRINNLTLNDVVSNNNVTTSSIFVSSPFGINDPISETYGEINYYNREFSLTDDNYDTILKTYKNTLVLYDSLGNTATIKTLNFGDDVVITLPDASGQLMTYTYANSTFLAKLDTTNMLKNYQRASAFPIATFGAGSGAAGDTSAFTTEAIYGSFYLNAGSDTIIVTGYTGVVQGTSASVTPTIYFNDTLNVAGTKIVNSPSAVTSTTTGNTVTSLDNTTIPPGNFVWVKTETVTTKPTYFNLTLIGYRKR